VEKLGGTNYAKLEKNRGKFRSKNCVEYGEKLRG
jgi:hypothetical protein